MEILPIEVWHYRNFETFDILINETTLNQDNLYDDGRIHQQSVFYEILENGSLNEYQAIDPQDHFYIKVAKGTDFYLVPKRFIEFLPVKPKAFVEVKLKKTETQVWKLITEIESMKIPKRMFWTFKDSILQWNPVEVTNARAYTLLKLLAWSIGVKYAMCSNVAGGKNSNLTLLRHIMHGVSPKIKHPSKAKFYQLMFYNQILNMDEITSWKSEEVQNIEGLCADAADSTPDMDKYAKDQNRNMEKLHFGDKSISFTFNRPDELKKREFQFEMKFNNPSMIIDRYPRFLIHNKVLSSIAQPSEAKSKEIVEQYKTEIMKIMANFAYWREEYTKHLHHYNHNANEFKGRHYDNLRALFDRLDCFCESQEEFDDWLRYVWQLHQNYLAMVNYGETYVVPETTNTVIPKIKEEEIADTAFKNYEVVEYEGKQVGFIDGDTYVKHCNHTHYMVKFQGFGVSVEVLSDLVMKRVRTIVVEYTTKEGKLEKYSSELQDWLKSTKSYNWNGDEQKFISLKQMKRTD